MHLKDEVTTWSKDITLKLWKDRSHKLVKPNCKFKRFLNTV